MHPPVHAVMYLHPVKGLPRDAAVKQCTCVATCSLHAVVLKICMNIICVIKHDGICGWSAV